MTQEQLAEAIGVTSGAISQLENGIINYTQPTLESIALALGCAPSDLLGRDPHHPPKDRPEHPIGELMRLAAGMSEEDMRALLHTIRSAQSDELAGEPSAEPPWAHEAIAKSGARK